MRPGDAPWLAIVRQHLAGLDAAPAAAANGEAAAIAALDPDAQQAAIRGMVARSRREAGAKRRRCAGWLRLIRAYGVLHETDKAKDALASARKAMAGDEAAAMVSTRWRRNSGLGS